MSSGTCTECGADLPEEIDPGTGVYCDVCGTGQHVADGGDDELGEESPVGEWEDYRTDTERVLDQLTGHLAIAVVAIVVAIPAYLQGEALVGITLTLLAALALRSRATIIDLELAKLQGGVETFEWLGDRIEEEKEGDR